MKLMPGTRRLSMAPDSTRKALTLEAFPVFMKDKSNPAVPETIA
jgi:hypothetical protein